MIHSHPQFSAACLIKYHDWVQLPWSSIFEAHKLLFRETALTESLWSANDIGIVARRVDSSVINPTPNLVLWENNGVQNWHHVLSRAPTKTCARRRRLAHLSGGKTGSAPPCGHLRKRRRLREGWGASPHMLISLTLGGPGAQRCAIKVVRSRASSRQKIITV